MCSCVRIACCAALLVLSGVALAADQTGEVRGTVSDDSGAPLVGVRVTARGPSLQGERSAVSDGRGSFRLPLLPVGVYDLIFELDRFERLTLTGVEVRLGAAATPAVTLRVAPFAEEITVTAANPLVDPTRVDTSYRLRGDDLARVPAQGRTIAEVVAFTPGVTGVRFNTSTGSDSGLPSFRGEGDAGNNWLVDGLSTKGVATNDPGVRVNYDAWDEVQVVSDGFAPELGQAMGGFVNVVTKSGGNEFHGEAGALVRDGSLRATREEQLSAASLPETSVDHYFANLGGPIVRDRLWFFLSDNWISTVDETSDQAVGWLEIPAGELTTTSNNLFAKLTFTPGASHSLSASGTYEDSPDQTGGIGLPEMYSWTSRDDSSYRLNYAGILGPDFFLTAAAGQNRRDSDTVPASGDYGPPPYQWYDIAQWTNNFFQRFTASERRSDVAAAGNWALDGGRWGRHELGAGASYFENRYCQTSTWTGRNLDPWPGNGFDDGAQVNWYAPGVPESLLELEDGGQDNSTRGYGFYLQDTVTFGRATLMLGLRTDTQEVFSDAGERLWSWGPGDFLQPRASLAVDLSGDGRTVLKAAYGELAMPMASAALGFFNHTVAQPFRSYGWVGPANPTDAQLEDPANWEFWYGQSSLYTPQDIDPDLEPDRVRRALLAVERQLGRAWAVKLRGVWSHADDLIEDVAVYDPEADDGFSFLVTNFDLKRRDYRALELELNGRMGGTLSLDASYTWSRARGTVPGNSFEGFVWGPGWGSGYNIGGFGDHADLPDDDPRKPGVDAWYGGLGGPGVGDEGWYGELPYSVDHAVKVLATWNGPHGLRVSPAFEWLSGYHWEKKGLAGPAYAGFPEGRGSRTTPDHAYLDLAVNYELSLGKGLSLDLGVSVYNLLDSQRPVAYVKEDTELFGQVWARQLPRWVQLTAAVRW